MHALTTLALTTALLTPAAAFAEEDAPATQRETQPEQTQDQQEQDDFEILMESPQPEGWPEPGPAFEISIKHYPAYRAAVKEGGNGFWPLFRHISSRDIPMTAPVEMAMEEDEGRYRMTNMAFLYQSLEVGETGEAEDGVQVIDYPAISVVNFGSNGNYNQDKIDQILEAIDAYLETIAEQWQPTGEMRIMGYNSPMVPPSKRYYEVQVVIEPVPQKEDSDQADAQETPADE